MTVPRYDLPKTQPYRRIRTMSVQPRRGRPPGRPTENLRFSETPPRWGGRDGVPYKRDTHVELPSCRSAGCTIDANHPPADPKNVCHPERPQGVEGSSHRFECRSYGSAKILRRATLAQDDRFGGWSFWLTFQSSQDLPDAAGIGGRFLNRPYEIFGFLHPCHL